MLAIQRLALLGVATCLVSGMARAQSWLPETPWKRTPPAPVQRAQPEEIPAPKGDPLPPPVPPGLRATAGQPHPGSSGVQGLEAAAELPRDENLTLFDPLAIELRYRDGRWVLMNKEAIVKDFGDRQEEGRRAWHLIRELHLNQHATLGSPQPVLEYWLRDGQAPASLPRGMRMLPLNAASLRVDQAQGFWVLRDSARVLFNFGEHETEARQALAVFRKYRFSQVGVIGNASPAMLVFVAQPESGGRAFAGGSTFSSRSTEKPQGAEWMSPRPALGKEPPRTGAPTFYPTPVVGPLRSIAPSSSTSTLGEPNPNRRSLGTAPVQATLPGMERLAFDSRQTRVLFERGEWILTAGSQVIGRFPNEREARLAHAAVLHFRLTEWHRHTGEDVQVGYFLSGGQAPRGSMVGLVGEHFRHEDLGVREINGRHWLTNGGRPLLDCGPRDDEVRYLLDVIRKYQFDQLCRIGSNERTGMTLLMRSRSH